MPRFKDSNKEQAAVVKNLKNWYVWSAILLNLRTVGGVKIFNK